MISFYLQLEEIGSTVVLYLEAYFATQQPFIRGVGKQHLLYPTEICISFCHFDQLRPFNTIGY